MRFAYLKYRLKKMGCYLLIIILLPYIITVFLSVTGSLWSFQSGRDYGKCEGRRGKVRQ